VSKTLKNVNNRMIRFFLAILQYCFVVRISIFLSLALHLMFSKAFSQIPNFTRTENIPIFTDGGRSKGVAWGDFDRDGFMDLFITNSDASNFLYRNKGDGTFLRIRDDIVVTDAGDSYGCSWGDFDNDGFLDLFVANSDDENNFLYKNNRDGTFTKITEGDLVNDGGHSMGVGWADFDNDGFLDLFVANSDGENNFLYNNNQDGTFTKVTEGDLVNDGGHSMGVGWADFDNDGFLDLYVPNSGPPLSNPNELEGNFLYQRQRLVL